MFSHIDEKNRPTMVDVSEKKATFRQAKAYGEVYLPDCLDEFFKDNEIHSKKGPVFQTAIIAGTMAVKKTWELIPFCHPLLIEGIKFDISRKNKNIVAINCEVNTTGKTGIEIEALNGVQVAALTIFDMCKAISKEVKVSEVRLLEKKGGKSDFSSL